MPKGILVTGVTYHGSTSEHLGGLDNVYGKHVSADTLRRHLRWLSGRFNIVGLAELLQQVRNGIRPPQKSLFIVFHDGYKGNYEVAFPILRELGLKATFFLTTDFIGTDRRFWVDILDAALKYSEKNEISINSAQGTETLPLRDGGHRYQASLRLRQKLKTLPTKGFEEEFARVVDALEYTDLNDIPKLGDYETCMNWDMVREMAAAGMEFGSHTHRHTICARQDEATAREEMELSKAILERELGRPCDLFCYPQGSYPRDGNDTTDRLAYEVGYKGVLYMVGPFNLLHPGTFRLTGIAFGETSDVQELRRALSRWRYRRRRLLGSRIWPWDRDTL